MPGLIAAAAAEPFSFAHLTPWDGRPVLACLALPLCLLPASRGRWVTAGALTGVIVVLEPLLAPVALLFVFARRWRALAVLLLVSGAVSGAVPLGVSGAVSGAVPLGVSGAVSGAVPLGVSGAGPVPPGLPRAPAEWICLLAAASGVLCAYRRWSAGDAGPLRLLETATGLMLSALLVARPSYECSLLIVVPLLLAGARYAGSAARRPRIWLALVPQLPGLPFPGLPRGRRPALRGAFTLCALTVSALTLAGAAVRRPRRTRRRRSALERPDPACDDAPQAPGPVTRGCAAADPPGALESKECVQSAQADSF
ncbi:hypothetical protein GCM10009601_36310 [Streptomyces thermospinosisporus]|uniref:Integral membrane protein n=1 Tax=Streptomyces thermospinosisporus TaxID=161482 RepID=A0ABP4JRZ8_9ACTN